jgi:hypothetical protein
VDAVEPVEPVEPDDRRPPEPLGGDDACWLDRVCDACGRLVESGATCPACGASLG